MGGWGIDDRLVGVGEKDDKKNNMEIHITLPSMREHKFTN